MGTPGVGRIQRQKAVSGGVPELLSAHPVLVRRQAMGYGSDRHGSIPPRKGPPGVAGSAARGMAPRGQRSGWYLPPSSAAQGLPEGTQPSQHLPFVTERPHTQSGQWAGEQEGSQRGQRPRAVSQTGSPLRPLGQSLGSQHSAPQGAGSRPLKLHHV